MTLWEFLAARDGHILSNKTEDESVPAMSIARARELGIEGL